MAQNDPALLTRLRDSGLEFVVIGGVCVVYHGAPVATFELEICCTFGEENIKRIESVLQDLRPVHRLTAKKLSLEATRSSFASLKNLCLQTDLGQLDCLSEVLGIGNFEAVFKQSILANFPCGDFHVLNIDALIASKSAAGREKDVETVRLLRAIKERKEQQNELF